MTMAELVDNEIEQEKRKAEEQLEKAQAEAEQRKAEEQRAEEDRKAQEALAEQKRQAEAERKAEEDRKAEERRKEKEARDKAIRRERLAAGYKEFLLVASVLEKFTAKVEMPEAEREFIMPYSFNKTIFEDALKIAQGAADEVLLELKGGQKCTLY